MLPDKNKAGEDQAGEDQRKQSSDLTGRDLRHRKLKESERHPAALSRWEPGTEDGSGEGESWPGLPQSGLGPEGRTFQLSWSPYASVPSSFSLKISSFK